jgi:hypothetical protein
MLGRTEGDDVLTVGDTEGIDDGCMIGDSDGVGEGAIEGV